MNVVTLSGFLTRDVDYRTTQKQDGSQGSVARFTVACSRGKDDTDFVSCVAFNKSADLINKYFSKGKGIELQGSIRTGNFTDKSGNKVYTTDVWVERVEFPKTTKADNAQQNNNAPMQAPPQGNIPQGVNSPQLPFNQQTPPVAPQETAMPYQTQPTPVQPSPTPQPVQYNPYDPYGGWVGGASAPFN